MGNQCSLGTQSPVTTNAGNACGNLPDLNFQYGGTGDNWTLPFTNISSATCATCGGGTGPFIVTAKVSSPSFNPGVGTNNVSISGLQPKAFSGAQSVTASSCTGTPTVCTFQYQLTSDPGAITTNHGTVQTLPVCGGSPTPGVTCVTPSADGTTLTYAGVGNPFHDSTTTWGQGSPSVQVSGTVYSMYALTSTAGACSAWPLATGCPTQVKLKTALPCAPTCSTTTQLPFEFNSPSIVRKNCDETKEAENEPPFHACDNHHVWHVKGYEHIPIPEQFDYTQFER